MRTSLAAILIFLGGACNLLNVNESVFVAEKGEVIASGTVLSIHDAVPVDGGVTIVLRMSGGHELTAYLPSFFRHPPPPQSDWDIYEILRDVRTGDAILIAGPVTDTGIRITKIRR